MQIVELLSPAKNLSCGLAAVNHGADAVYVGAPSFGARAAAGNSLADIKSLVDYAHRFRVKVYVALNTILTDKQLPEVEKLIRQIYELGADALIVQDMGILQLDIPPIALHASTQTDNRTIEKVQFLENVGFSRVVLARELTLNQIKAISNETQIELECFVHGALCVSYSGQCYISQAVTGRSANRGECAQFCRLPYHLTDANGTVLQKNKHLLSLKDLNLSEHLDELIDAGVTSFKIEGRLKDEDYVKNITSFYRKKLDAILNSDHRSEKAVKASSGNTVFFFEPDPEKTFQRGFTDFFFNERQPDQSQPASPKSMGEKIGEVVYSDNNFIEVSSNKKIHTADGICFINDDGILEGFSVNGVETIANSNANFTESSKTQNHFEEENVERFLLHTAGKIKPSTGTVLYRNFDYEFEKILAGKTAERKIEVDLVFGEFEEGFFIQLTDEEHISVKEYFQCEKQPAKNAEKSKQTIENQLSKLGNTIYEARSISIETQNDWFIPISTLNDWRRQAIDSLDIERDKKYIRKSRKEINGHPIFPEKKLSYLGNVTNEKAEAFYRQFGVEEIKPGFEVKAEAGVPLMFCKYCIKHEYGWCPKDGYKATFEEPLFLHNQNQKFRLEFDCKRCEMQVLKA